MQPLIKSYKEFSPVFGKNVRLAENSTVVGDVEFEEGVNLWYGAVVRGDVGRVRIARNANLQDLCCVHMTKYRSDAFIGEEASIGHAALVHGAIIEAGVLIGMGAIIMDNARIGEGSIIGAGALVTADTVIPARSLVIGRPGKVVRQLSDEEAQAGRKTSGRYLGLAEDHFTVYTSNS